VPSGIVESSGEISHIGIWTGLALLVACAVAVRAPMLGNRFFSRIENFGARFAQRKRLAIASVALTAVIVRLILLFWIPVPVPRVQDEFSHLLVGDTFVHGRLTNPPNPMWVYLDTFQVNQLPTYMSMYPPGQGAVLALGELLGQPWFGVLLSVAAMCAAAVWALQGWLPARWALLGGVLVMLRLAIFGYWINSYWGGAVAAVGGALVVGALPRIMKFARPRDALILGVGVSILANSRPFEGMIFCLPVAAALLWWLFRTAGITAKERFRRVLVPLCAAGVICVGFDAYYNWRGTGNPMLFPYVLNVDSHFAIPQLIGRPVRPPFHFQNVQFDDYYNKWWRVVARPSGLREIRYDWLNTFRASFGFFLWPELCFPLLALPWLFRDRRVRLLLWQAGVSIAGFFLVVLFHPHYAAPLTVTMFALLTQGLRHLRQWRFGDKPVGIALARVVVLFAVILVPLHRSYSMAFLNMDRRSQIVHELEGKPGQHLVIVRYSPEHNAHAEWVYNGADIDGAKIVWVRYIPGTSLEPILAYFHNRQIWFVDPDDTDTTPTLLPYRSAQRPPAASAGK
jgi:hypothetical protein